MDGRVLDAGGVVVENVGQLQEEGVAVVSEAEAADESDF